LEEIGNAGRRYPGAQRRQVRDQHVTAIVQVLDEITEAPHLPGESAAIAQLSSSHYVDVLAHRLQAILEGDTVMKVFEDPGSGIDRCRFLDTPTLDVEVEENRLVAEVRGRCGRQACGHRCPTFAASGAGDGERPEAGVAHVSEGNRARVEHFAP